MKSSAGKIQLTGFDDLFQSSGSVAISGERVQDVPVSELFPFKNQPFQVRDDEAMQKTTENFNIVDVLDHVFAEEAKLKWKRAYEKQIQMAGSPIKKTSHSTGRDGYGNIHSNGWE